MGRVFNTSQTLSKIARSAQPLSFINVAEYDPLLAAIDSGEAFLRGSTTDSGEVAAASDWDEPAQRKIVRRALPNSIESLFHETLFCCSYGKSLSERSWRTLSCKMESVSSIGLKPSASGITSRHACLSSSMQSFTSIAPSP